MNNNNPPATDKLQSAGPGKFRSRHPVPISVKYINFMVYHQYPL